MISHSMKNVYANARARDYEQAHALLEKANEATHKALLRMNKGEFEDAHSECENAQACSEVALRHLEELLP